MYRPSAYPHLLCKFSDGDTMVLHDQSPHVVNELVISACWEPTGTSVNIHPRAAIFESVAPLLNLCDAHGIIVDNPLNLPKTRWIFRMVSTRLSPSFWQKFMQYCCSSRSVIFAEINSATRAAYKLSHTRWLHGTDAVSWRAKNHVCTWRSPPPLYHSTPAVLH